MSSPESGYQSLPGDVQQLVRDRCTRFAETWQPESLNQLSSIVAEPIPETKVGDETLVEGGTVVNEVLLYELLRIDVQKRVDSGQVPSPSTYKSKFPDDTRIISSVFDELDTRHLQTLDPVPASAPPTIVETPLDDRETQVPETSIQTPKSEPLIHPDQSTAGDPQNANTIDEPISNTDVATFAESQLATMEQTEIQSRLKASTIPHTLGDYQLLNKLGEGGMGVVYLATQMSAGRKVALKIIRPDRLGGISAGRTKTTIERFRTEALAAAKIQHENLVTVYEVGFENECHFFSMQYVEGPSLSEVIRKGPVESRQAAEWLAPACRAVHAVHNNGIVHRDLKPQNIMLEEATGKTLVADFGLAKLSDSDVELTHTGEAMGTPPYMSPEQFRDAASVTASTDVYALGATLYHLLSGRPPFQAATTAKTMRLVLDKDPVELRKFNPTVDKDVETICMKCLDKEPAKRYASAEEVADELQRYIEGRPINARPLSKVQRSSRWAKRNPLVASFAGVAVISLAVAMVSLVVANANTEASRKLSEASFHDALDAVNDFFTKVSEERLLNEPGMQGLRKDLLLRANDYYSRLLERRSGDKTVTKELAGTHYRLGVIVEQLYPDDLEKAISSYKLALESQEAILQKVPVKNSKTWFEAARAVSLTSNALGRAYVAKGASTAFARKHFKDALKLREQMIESAKSESQQLEATRLWANTQMNLGIMKRRSSDFVDAKRLYELAQVKRDAVLKTNPQSRELRRDIAKGCINIANVLIDESQDAQSFDAISKQLKRAIAILESLLKQTPGDLQDRYLLMICHRMLGDAHSALAEKTPAQRGFAIDEYTQAEQVARELTERNPDVDKYRVELSGLLMNVGLLLAQEGKFGPALREFLEARVLLTALKQRVRDLANRPNKNKTTTQSEQAKKIEQDLASIAQHIRTLQNMLQGQ